MLQTVHQPVPILQTVHQPVPMLQTVHQPVPMLQTVHQPVPILQTVHPPVLIHQTVHPPVLVLYTHLSLYCTPTCPHAPDCTPTYPHTPDCTTTCSCPHIPHCTPTCPHTPHCTPTCPHTPHCTPTCSHTPDCTPVLVLYTNLSLYMYCIHQHVIIYYCTPTCPCTVHQPVLMLQTVYEPACPHTPDCTPTCPYTVHHALSQNVNDSRNVTVIIISHSAAVCKPDCQNEGTCASPGVCNCTGNWIGDHCEDGELYVLPRVCIPVSTCMYLPVCTSVYFCVSTKGSQCVPMCIKVYQCVLVSVYPGISVPVFTSRVALFSFQLLLCYTQYCICKL